MTGHPADGPRAPRDAPAPPAAIKLLAEAERQLAAAEECEDTGDAYLAVHFAALRAASAVLACRPGAETAARGRRRIRSVWEMLPEAAPTLAGWSAVFAGSAARRERLEAGILAAVDRSEVDELAAATATFVRIVQEMVPPQPPLPPPVSMAQPPAAPLARPTPPLGARRAHPRVYDGTARQRF